jgi:ribosomal 50S subunit-recycling heat shock protein
MRRPPGGRGPDAPGRAPLVPEDACRIDVWLWRARLFKTRALASRVVETGRIRLARGGLQSRAEKPSRLVRVGDELTFAQDGKLFAVRVEALGVRRGPPTEARSLYAPVEVS